MLSPLLGNSLYVASSLKNAVLALGHNSCNQDSPNDQKRNFGEESFAKRRVCISLVAKPTIFRITKVSLRNMMSGNSPIIKTQSVLSIPESLASVLTMGNQTDMI